MIVNEQWGRMGNILLEVAHETMKPDGFFCGFSGSNILGFSGGLGNAGLQFRSPGDGASSE